MKKTILAIFLFAGLSFSIYSQKIASVDMAYIMKNIPTYESANEQLNQVSKKWQQEVDASMKEVQEMYKNYQTELVFMTEDAKVKREDEIVAKEKAAQELKRKYFGAEGELFKKRQTLMKPIQDEVYAAVQEICNAGGIEFVFDKSSSMNAVFVSPKIDISDEVLKKLGYSK
ncbi:MAG: OmpH family outer membrane protein [Paludibacteraceae bacterium]